VRITIAGGGPAGLYFGLLMKRQDPRHEVRIFERDGRHDTYGWGIVFSGQTLSFLEQADPESHRAITGRLELWDNVDVVHRGEKVSIRGNRFAGIARVAFLDILRGRCEELGVEVRYHTNVQSVADLPAADLLVGADGANSLVRGAYADAFRPSLDVRHNRYIWLGTRRLFPGLTLTFRESEAGVFAAHSYKFGPDTSTFIVEAVGDTWGRAGFEGMGAEETRATLERVFERFYRADQARTRATGGSGLGLAIVNALVSAHGGVASVRTAPGKGATFRIALPLAPEARGGAAADDDPDLDEAVEAPDQGPGPGPAGGVADGTAAPAGSRAADEAGEDVVTFGGKPAGGSQSA
jgi:flavin-dependent dehydrogenase